MATFKTVHRKGPSHLAKQLAVLFQNNRCFYCGTVLGEMFKHRNKLLVARIHWDHVVPVVYSHDNRDGNFVAACQQCNHLKSSKIFDTYDDAKNYIIQEREARGMPVYRVRRVVPEKEAVAKVLQCEVSDEQLLEASQDCQNRCVAIMLRSTCAYCGAEFVKRRAWKKFCSASCANKSWIEEHPRVAKPQNHWD